MKLSHSYSAIKMFENCPLRYYRQRVLKDVVDEPSEQSRYGERIHKMLEDRIGEGAMLPSEAAKYEDICASIETAAAHGGELFAEKELVLTENLTPTGWWDADAWLRSKLDVFVLYDNKAIVLDWKTGKRRIDNFQLKLFAAQVMQHYPDVDSVKTGLIWLKTNEFDYEVFDRDQLNDIWADVISRIRRIYKSLEHDKWPARPSGLCRFCPARHDCDFAQV